MPITPTDEGRLKVEKVRQRKVACEKAWHNDFRTRSEHFYSLYRGYSEFKSAWKDANDRDGVIYDAQSGWGAKLFIPYTFAVIESLAPRAVANRPRMLYNARREEDESKVDAVRVLIDAQQGRIDYDLTLQDVLKTGFFYGLGVQKVYWRKEYVMKRPVRSRTIRLPGQSPYALGDPTPTLWFDDPMAAWVDPFDFFADPFGHNMDTCRWACHRVWLSLEQCLENVKYKRWSTPEAQQLTEDELRSMGSSSKFGEVWNQRMNASGYDSFNVQGEQLHEVWEYWDREKVCTILDGELLVQEAENPCLGHLPFQIYRPTNVPGQLVGIGEIEPIEHLQREMNTLRSQRRDAATLAILAPYVFDEGNVDAGDIVFAPGKGIGVRGNPRESFMKLDLGDVPGSSYSESEEIKRDIERTSGVSDATAGGEGDNSGAAATATGAQLIQASVNKRVENKSHRLEAETIRPAARAFLAWDQRMILEDRTEREEVPTADANVSRWKWVTIGPPELQGEFEIEPEGGSTQAENMPAQIDKATRLWNMFGQDPQIDQTWLRKEVLQLMGVKHPEAKLAAQDRLPPEVLQNLIAAGVPQDLVQLALQMAQREQPMAGQQPAQPDQGAAA